MRHLILLVTASTLFTACQAQPLPLSSAFSGGSQSQLVLGQATALESLNQPFALTANSEGEAIEAGAKHQAPPECGPPTKGRMAPPPPPEQSPELDADAEHAAPPHDESEAEHAKPPCPPPRPPREHAQAESGEDMPPPPPREQGQTESDEAKPPRPPHEQKECDEEKPPRPPRPDLPANEAAETVAQQGAAARVAGADSQAPARPPARRGR